MRYFPKFPLVLAAAALIVVVPANAKTMCLSAKGKFLAKPSDPYYCSCIAKLTPKQITKFRIDADDVDECLLTTGSLGNLSLITPPSSINPPVVPPTPPGDDGNGKGNNGLGNGSDPAPPGIGNAGNDGGDVAVGSVAVTPGSPGGSGTAPGQN